MLTLQDLEKKINSELTTKIKRSKISHSQIYINIDSEDIVDVILFLKNNEKTKCPKTHIQNAQMNPKEQKRPPKRKQKWIPCNMCFGILQNRDFV